MPEFEQAPIDRFYKESIGLPGADVVFKVFSQLLGSSVEEIEGNLLFAEANLGFPTDTEWTITLTRLPTNELHLRIINVEPNYFNYVGRIRKPIMESGFGTEDPALVASLLATRYGGNITTILIHRGMAGKSGVVPEQIDSTFEKIKTLTRNEIKGQVKEKSLPNGLEFEFPEV